MTIKKKTLIISVIALLSVAALIVAGILFWPEAQPEIPKGDALRIEWNKKFPNAYLGEPYDLRQIINMQEGVSYSAAAVYQNYDTMESFSLEVTDLYFTQNEMFDIRVTVTAQKGAETAQRSIEIPVEIRADPVDDLLRSGGLLSWAEGSISKQLNADPTYVKGENSKTSLLVTHQNSDSGNNGKVFLSIAGEEIMPYLTDRKWENAALTFWVYNPMPEPFEFQMYFVDGDTGFYIDWTNDEKPTHQRQYAAPGEWTQIKFSLKRVGIVRPYSGEKDVMSVRVRYGGHPGAGITYEYNFYTDGLDVVPASQFPDLDTTPRISSEPLSAGWENLNKSHDSRYTDSYYDYDTFIGENSICSLHATFTRYNKNFYPNVTLSVGGDKRMPEKPDMTGGTLSGYFKFKNSPAEVKVDLVKNVDGKRVKSNYLPMTLEPVGDGWYKGTLDVADFELVSARNDEILQVNFTFKKATEDSEIWIDSLYFEPKDTQKVKESPSVDWINVPVDVDWTNVTYKYSTSYLKGGNSVRSVHLSAPADKTGLFVVSHDVGIKFGLTSTLPDITKGVMRAYFYFGNQTPKATVGLVNSYRENCKTTDFVFEDLGGGWYRGSVPVSLLTGYAQGDGNDIEDVLISIPKGYSVYLDNLMFFPNEKFEWNFDPNDLFASGVFSVSGLTDGKSGYQKLSDETTGREDAIYVWAKEKAGWPFVRVSFPEPVDFTQFTDIQYDAKWGGVGSKWLGINLVYRDKNGKDIPVALSAGSTLGEWETITVKLSQFPDVDLTKIVGVYIGLNHSDGMENGSKYYLDNLRVIAVPEDKNDLLADAVMEYGAYHNSTNKGGQEGYSYQSDCTDVVNGDDSLRSWKFTIDEGAGGKWGKAQVKLSQAVDMTGKLLTFDVKLENLRGWMDVSLADSNWKTIGKWSGDIQNTTEWQTVTIDPADFTGTGDISKLFLITFGVVDGAVSNVERTFYIDNVRLIDAQSIEPEEPTESEPTEPTAPTDPSEPTEPVDANDLLADAKMEYGAYHTSTNKGAKDGYSYDSNCTEVVNGEESIRSWKFTIEAGKGGSWGKAQVKLSQAVDMTGKLLVFDVKLENLKGWMDVVLADSSWKSIGKWSGEIQNTTAWQTVTIDPAGFTGTGDISKLFLITFGVADGSVSDVERTFYIDNVRLIDAQSIEPEEPTESEPTEPTAPTDPSEPTEPVDANDLLADAKMEYGAYHTSTNKGAKDGYSYDSNCTEVVNGEESIRSWKFTIEAGKGGSWGKAQVKLSQAVDMTGKLLVFDVKLENLKGWMDVALADSSWKTIGKWSGDIQNTTAWQTVTIDPADFTGTGDISKLFLITFGVADGAVSDVERTFYIDNVRLVDVQSSTEPALKIQQKIFAKKESEIQILYTQLKQFAEEL